MFYQVLTRSSRDVVDELGALAFQSHHLLLTELLLVLQVTDHTVGLQDTNALGVIPEVLVAVLAEVLGAVQIILILCFPTWARSFFLVLVLLLSSERRDLKAVTRHLERDTRLGNRLLRASNLVVIYSCGLCKVVHVCVCVFRVVLPVIHGH